MATAGEIVIEAMEHAGVKDHHNNLKAKEQTKGLSLLNDMLGEWNQSLGWDMDTLT